MYLVNPINHVCNNKGEGKRHRLIKRESQRSYAHAAAPLVFCLKVIVYENLQILKRRHLVLYLLLLVNMLTSYSKLYSTITDYVRQTRTVRQINDPLLVKFIYIVLNYCRTNSRTNPTLLSLGLFSLKMYKMYKL